jgi:hypothetical protein
MLFGSPNAFLVDNILLRIAAVIADKLEASFALMNPIEFAAS